MRRRQLSALKSNIKNRGYAPIQTAPSFNVDDYGRPKKKPKKKALKIKSK